MPDIRLACLSFPTRRAMAPKKDDKKAAPAKKAAGSGGGKAKKKVRACALASAVAVRGGPWGCCRRQWQQQTPFDSPRHPISKACGIERVPKLRRSREKGSESCTPRGLQVNDMGIGPPLYPPGGSLQMEGGGGGCRAAAICRAMARVAAVAAAAT